jgi:hypothetical protein
MLNQNVDMPTRRMILYAVAGMAVAALIGYMLLEFLGDAPPEDLGPLIRESNELQRQRMINEGSSDGNQRP